MPTRFYDFADTCARTFAARFYDFADTCARTLPARFYHFADTCARTLPARFWNFCGSVLELLRHAFIIFLTHVPELLRHASVGLPEVCYSFVESSILIMKILLFAHTLAVRAAAELHTGCKIRSEAGRHHDGPEPIRTVTPSLPSADSTAAFTVALGTQTVTF